MGEQVAILVEIEKKAVQTIQTNLQITGLGDKAIIRRMDAIAFLKHPTGQTFDVIYSAPPQYKGLWLTTLTALDTHPAWLHPETTVILQIDPSEQQPVTLQNLVTYDERRYGKTLLWFLAPPTGEE